MTTGPQFTRGADVPAAPRAARSPADGEGGDAGLVLAAPGTRGARGDLVHEAIKAGIREGKLRAGQRLRETEIAEWLGVSRTPVREAFKKLEAQGIVSSVGGDGLVIRTFTPREIAELYAARADLESIVAHHAAQNARASEIKIMQDICERWDVNLSATELGQLNAQLHEAIYSAANNMFLQRALMSIDDSVALLGLQTFSVAQGRADADQDHRAIVGAIAARDPQAAAAAARAHIERAEKTRLLVVA